MSSCRASYLSSASAWVRPTQTASPGRTLSESGSRPIASIRPFTSA